MAPPFFLFSLTGRSSTNAFYGREGPVGFGVGVEQENFEGPIFAGLEGAGVGRNVSIGDDLTGGIEQGEVDFHGEVTVLGNIFNGAGDVFGTVVFIGGETVSLEEEIRILNLGGGGFGSRLRGSCNFSGGEFFSQSQFHQHGVAGTLAEAKGFASGGPLQN